MEVTYDKWADSFWGFDQNQRFVVVLVIIGCITGIVITLTCVLLAAISTMHRTKHEAELKRELLDRGLSADDLEKIIGATAPDSMTKQLNAVFGRKR